ncbi:hypothetical protein [Bifidobacterium biavatii]|uniref:Glycosyltransferase n=1 Tax=Bifidobacterium biavatii DSM 23969 TaxID=1437608 RepID=A0A086ZN03_9BIFI|nr:hypothetical protein [Bifidobacterium biavatii]KFI47903.1 glycosyltransferase [Bifidobacterium biavatii DSM 23969]
MGSLTRERGSFAARRVLITQSVLANIGGSEVQAVELARFFRSQGADVTLFAWQADDPMRSIVGSEGFRVVLRSDPAADGLHVADFDVIWVQHEVLPESVIRDLGRSAGGADASATAGERSRCRFVFSHMSPFRELYMEFPYLRGLEPAVASMSVFNSAETMESQSAFLPPDDDRVMVYPNPAPSEYADHDPADADGGETRDDGHAGPRRVLVVSNHAPGEVVAAADELAARGCRVDYLREVAGIEGGSRITSVDLLSRYDCVITIGKTVQYCLVAGIPVYVYDHFGGPGYLNDDNLETADHYNFSGRMKPYSRYLTEARNQAAGVRVVDAAVLADDIANGYDRACAWQRAHRADFVNRYGIVPVMDRLFARIETEAYERPALTADMVEYLAQAQRTYADFTVERRENVKPDRDFYAQHVQVFSSDDGVFHASGLTQSLPLTRQVSFEIGPDSAGHIRIDYGERPCTVSGFAIEGVDRALCRVESNAFHETDDEYVFLSGDPQILLTLPPGRTGTVTVHATVLSMTSSGQIVDRMLDRLRQRDARQAEDRALLQSRLAEAERHAELAERHIRDIEESKWWKLGERLRAAIRSVKKSK